MLGWLLVILDRMLRSPDRMLVILDRMFLILNRTLIMPDRMFEAMCWE